MSTPNTELLAQHLLNAVITDKKAQLSLAACEKLIREKMMEVSIAFFSHMTEPENTISKENLIEAYKTFETEFVN